MIKNLKQKELTDSHEQIVNLQSKIEMMKMKEEDALLSLAENKLIIHKELETKESQIKNLKDKIAENEKDVKQLKSMIIFTFLYFIVIKFTNI